MNTDYNTYHLSSNLSDTKWYATQGWVYDHFNNIQNAINATEFSGTVNVSKGNYYENILIDKPINLICKDNEKAIIDGSAAGNVITVTNPIFMLEGFIITNSGIKDAGIIINSSYIDNSSLFFMKNNDISNCGDGISIKNLNNGRVDIQNCIIKNNLKIIDMWSGGIGIYTNFLFSLDKTNIGKRILRNRLLILYQSISKLSKIFSNQSFLQVSLYL